VIGRKLGNYEVIDKLGEGGMGEVWRASDRRLNRMVAIKMLPAALAAEPGLRARLSRRLAHSAPSIIRTSSPYTTSARMTVVAEALVNRVPPLVSDRGGLAESCNGAGFVLPLPPDLTERTRRPVSAEAVEPWIEPIVKLAFDEPFYQESVERTRRAARIYAREELAPRYVDFFVQTLRASEKR